MKMFTLLHTSARSLSLLCLSSSGCFDVGSGPYGWGVMEDIKERFILPRKSSIPVTICRETDTGMIDCGSWGKRDE